MITVIHWKAAEAASLLELLRNAGYTVEYEEGFSRGSMQAWRQKPPSAFVIDLSRLPSHGREIAIALRQSPKTRQVPIVFSGGKPEKIEPIQALFPDAAFCREADVAAALKQAKPPEKPVRPIAIMDRYGSRSVAEKLGIREGSAVRLIDAPGHVEAVLTPLPANVEFTEDAAGVTLCFIHGVDEARAKISALRNVARKAKLWILWRKKGAPGHAGVDGNFIRETAIGLGLVDYKICAVGDVWSAMAFARRTEKG